MRAIRVGVFALTLAGCAAAPPPPPAPAPPKPQIIGWKNLDGSAAGGPAVEQVGLVCEEYATRQSNTVGLFFRKETHDTALKSCMAQRNYLPIIEMR